MSKDDVARILDEVAKLDERERKRVMKSIKRSLKEETAPSDAPSS